MPYENPLIGDNRILGGIAFQPVGNQRQAPAADTGPVQVQEIAIGGGDPLSLIDNVFDFPAKGRINRLQVSIAKYKWWVIAITAHIVGTFVERH